jgi:hypothetical protein
MDNNLKIMIARTMKVLGKQPDKSWNAVLSSMMRNELGWIGGCSRGQTDQAERQCF